MSHCRELFTFLRTVKYAHLNVRWIWIVQDQAEQEIREICDGLRAELLKYDRPVFNYSAMKRMFDERLKAERIDEAYIPLNHPEGRGYLHIIRFLAGLRIPKLFTHLPRFCFEEVTFPKFMIRRARAVGMDLGEKLILLAVVPFVVIYYFVVYAFRRFILNEPRDPS